MNRLFLALGLLIASFSSMGADMSNGTDNFYKSEKVIAEKVTFKNQYKMNVTVKMPSSVLRSLKNWSSYRAPTTSISTTGSTSFHSPS